MEALFTPDEMVYNTCLKGKQIIHSDDGSVFTIDYIKIIKKTRQLKVHTTNNENFLIDQDKIQKWVVAETFENKKNTRKKSRR